MTVDTPLAGVVPPLAEVSGIEAIVLGGLRARETADEASETDIRLDFCTGAPFDVDSLRRGASALSDDPASRRWRRATRENAFWYTENLLFYNSAILKSVEKRSCC